MTEHSSTNLSVDSSIKIDAPATPAAPTAYSNIPVGVAPQAVFTTSARPAPKEPRKLHPLYPFIALGSLIYAFFYTLFLYQNHSGITYPFFVGGTCFFFFAYLKKCGLTAKKLSCFCAISLCLLGISTCMTDSLILVFLNKAAIFCLFFYLALYSLYETKQWTLATWFANILQTIFASLEFIPYPFTDFSLYRKEKRASEPPREKKGKYVFYGILISLPLLWIVLLLLSGADAVFADTLDRLLSFDIDLEAMNHVVNIGGMFLFAFFSSYCLLCRFNKHALKEEVRDKRTHEPVIAITFTGILSFIYAFFCLIQIIYLFGGSGTLPEGYTYSSYAREGFFQLVFICMLNLSLVLICKKYFREHYGLKALLTFICGCTYIMIASSTYRMLLYIGSYHLTFLRVFVLWALLVITLLVSGALIYIYKEEFPLVKYYVITLTLLYLAFSFAHPDYWIARYNIDHSLTFKEKNGMQYYLEAKDSSLYYLSDLSLDAAPAIFELVSDIEKNTGTAYVDSYLSIGSRWYKSYCFDLLKESHGNPYKFSARENPLPQAMSWRKLNFSRLSAYKAYTAYLDTHPDFPEELDNYRY
ncbi:MAG: DUF4173 domain-containing protein [Lachnospiraceae bacterium]|nr:DUF4173 domain-containing protein [Lachnospiraceae bacterium]